LDPGVRHQHGRPDRQPNDASDRRADQSALDALTNIPTHCNTHGASNDGLPDGGAERRAVCCANC
jgi:hypothetical protein